MSQRNERRNSTARTAASRDLAVSDVANDRQAAGGPLRADVVELMVGAPAEERSATPDGAVDIPGLLALLPAFEDEIEAGERRLRECVRLLRAHRATWREIGDALQVSRQAAWERFRTS